MMLNKRFLLMAIGVLILVIIIITKYLSKEEINKQRQQTAEDEIKHEEAPKQQPYWNAIDVETMSANQIVNYLHFSNRSSCNLTHDFGGVMVKWGKIIPGIDGQKAICLDPDTAPDPNNCIVYSFGINNEWSFDSLMEKYGCQVFAFDPTMGKADHDYSAGIHFYNLGLGGADGTKNGWKIKSLSSIYEMLVSSHRHGPDAIIDYLKIDIEFDEWTALPEIISSGMIHRVRQMGIEFHLPRDGSLDDYRRLMSIIKAVEDSGMTRFDSKYNPWFMDYLPALNYTGSRGFEIAWYRLL